MKARDIKRDSIRNVVRRHCCSADLHIIKEDKTMKGMSFWVS